MKLFGMLFCAIFVMAFVSGVSAQKVLTSIELNELLVGSAVHRKDVSHRMVTVFETFTDKDLPATVINTQTIISVPPYSTHFISTSESDRGDHRSEQITIGETVYGQLSDGNWIVRPKINREPPQIKRMEIREDIPWPKMERSFEYRGKEQVCGKIADLYVRTTKMTPAFETEKEFYIAEEKYWIDESGILIKVVKENYSQDFKQFSRFTTTYDFDPNLKIEPPIQ